MYNYTVVILGKYDEQISMQALLKYEGIHFTVPLLAQIVFSSVHIAVQQASLFLSHYHI